MKKNFDLYDKFLDKLKYISITTSLILLMLTWGLIPSIILSFLNINPNIMPEILKVLYVFIFDITFIFIIIYLYKKEVKEEFYEFFNKRKVIHNIKTSLKYWIIGLMIMMTCNIIITIFTTELAANEEAVRGMIDKFPLYMAFQVMLYAPITEEIIFRKSIANIFKNKYLYIFFSGLIFGGLHVISSITSPIDYLYLLPYSSLGIIFALLYKKTNNIFSTITAHSIHNTLAFVLYLLTK